MGFGRNTIRGLTNKAVERIANKIQKQNSRVAFSEVDDAIKTLAKEIESQFDSEILELLNLANSDLYSGPIYLDEEGELATMWDEGATPFDFSKAVSRISAELEGFDIRDSYVTDMGDVFSSENKLQEFYFEDDLEMAKAYAEEAGESFDEEEFRENWTGEFMPPYYKISREDVLKEIVGKELLSYI